jgi:hypothetical protein
MQGKTILALEKKELQIVEPLKLFKVAVEMPLIHWSYLKQK